MISDAYAAGFFDGEGSVYAATRNRSNPAARELSLTVVVCISNTNLAVLERFREKWGGSISARSNVKPNHQRCYQWVVAARKAQPFLRAIHPHLVVKTDVVAAALECAELMSLPCKERIDYTQRRPSKVPGKLTAAGVQRPEFRAKMEALHWRIRELNGKTQNRTRQWLSANAPGPSLSA